MNTVLLMMGGSGTRFGADIPKQYIKVNDMPIFSYILKGYNDLSCVDKIIIVSHKDWVDYVEEIAKEIKADKLYKVVQGGDTRSDSVKNGLLCAKEFSSDNDVILIHDATHPYVDEKGVEEVIDGVNTYGGATLAQFNYDTVYKMDDDHILTNIEPRFNIVAGASPEAFTFGKIFDIYINSEKEELEKMTSAGAIALAHGIKMKVVRANVLNLKITYADDMNLFTKLVDNYFFPKE
ncbi:MAG: 2-C-methyl-D-erythritol 4-phosphate cytidylyltransferase [Oscillospiraceae bacterium]|nr:2-C-methyl-D-erythritol 4-phosphate cytidylyltransferase [Candidatus Ruminococcus equi]